MKKTNSIHLTTNALDTATDLDMFKGNVWIIPDFSHFKKKLIYLNWQKSEITEIPTSPFCRVYDNATFEDNFHNFLIYFYGQSNETDDILFFILPTKDIKRYRHLLDKVTDVYYADKKLFNINKSFLEYTETEISDFKVKVQKHV